MICKLTWLFSSFTYLPNFKIWLPSFSSLRLVQLARKYHLTIFAFVQFSDFFHSVKKVSKPSIFCEVICVLKRTLVILIRMLYCIAFFKAKKFVILFFLSSSIWFISGGGGGGISLGVIFPREGGFSQRAFFLGANFWGAIFLIPNIIIYLWEIHGEQL